jgi:hypothetical protein
MSLNGEVHGDAQHIILLAPTVITTAVGPVLSTPVTKLSGMKYLCVEAIFIYGADGTSADAYVQTSFDGGLTWVDLMNFHFLTTTASKISACTSCIAPAAQAFAPSDGALTANTIIQGVFGHSLRLSWTTVGTYSGSTSLAVYAVAKG